jgi:hypothetical protein
LFSLSSLLVPQLAGQDLLHKLPDTHGPHNPSLMLHITTTGMAHTGMVLTITDNGMVFGITTEIGLQVTTVLHLLLMLVPPLLLMLLPLLLMLLLHHGTTDMLLPQSLIQPHTKPPLWVPHMSLHFQVTPSIVPT